MKMNLDEELSGSTLSALNEFLKEQVQDGNRDKNDEEEENKSLDQQLDVDFSRKSTQRDPQEEVKRNTLPASNKEYYKKEYWEERFTSEEEYEWLLSYDDVKDMLTPYIKPNDNILVVGCGNSSLSADMYNAGFCKITNIDFSETVIANMQEKYGAACPGMRWVVADMLRLREAAAEGRLLPPPLPPPPSGGGRAGAGLGGGEATADEEGEGGGQQRFDVVLDKAAMDALVTVEGDPWDPDPAVIEQAKEMCTGVSHVLKDDGIFLQISFQQPHFRRKYLLGIEERKEGCMYYSGSYQWDLKVESIVKGGEGCFGDFLYVMQKQGL